MLYDTDAPMSDLFKPAPAVMYDVPVPCWTTYERARRVNPFGILPLPGEPVLGHVPGMLVVRASNGVEQGWYDYWADTFHTDAEWGA